MILDFRYTLTQPTLLLRYAAYVVTALRMHVRIKKWVLIFIFISICSCREENAVILTSFRFYQQNGATKIIAKSMFCLITATKQFCDLLIDISSQYQYVHRLGAYLSHFSAAVSLAGLSADCYYEIWKRACLNFISIYRH